VSSSSWNLSCPVSRAVFWRLEMLPEETVLPFVPCRWSAWLPVLRLGPVDGFGRMPIPLRLVVRPVSIRDFTLDKSTVRFRLSFGV